VGGASPVPVQMWEGPAQSRCRCGPQMAARGGSYMSTVAYCMPRVYCMVDARLYVAGCMLSVCLLAAHGACAERPCADAQAARVEVDDCAPVHMGGKVATAGVPVQVLHGESCHQRAGYQASYQALVGFRWGKCAAVGTAPMRLSVMQWHGRALPSVAWRGSDLASSRFGLRPMAYQRPSRSHCHRSLPRWSDARNQMHRSRQLARSQPVDSILRATVERAAEDGCKAHGMGTVVIPREPLFSIARPPSGTNGRMRSHSFSARPLQYRFAASRVGRAGLAADALEAKGNASAWDSEARLPDYHYYTRS
jgi:hypothetical protein